MSSVEVEKHGFKYKLQSMKNVRLKCGVRL